MRVLASACAVAALIAAGSANAKVSNTSGTWTGHVRQVDVDSETTYPITVKLQGAKGTSSYPTLKCTGTWARIGETKDGYAIYHERVVNEPDGTCIDGVFTVRADAGRLIVGWFGVLEGVPGMSSATLRREGR